MEDLLAIILIFGGGTVVALGFSPIGRALAARIRGERGPERDMLQEWEEQRAAQAGELEAVRREIGELAERLDFAERLLARQRDAERLPPVR
ncbi:MAG: hypothetical protein ACREME_01400 [Gemmatimonadales bacterium]